MITRFYVDNYKCLQNFEYKPEQLELIVGANGTGKSTVFEALDKVRRFVTGQGDAKDFFPPACGTRWGTRPQQTFELECITEKNRFHYQLQINLSSESPVEQEVLKRNDEVLIETSWEEQNGSHFGTPSPDSDSGNKSSDIHAGQTRVSYWLSESGLNIPLLNPNQSALSVYTSASYTRQLLNQIHFFKINPSAVTSQVGKVQPRPANDLSNFASYYLYLLQQKQGRMFDMIPHLREAIADFDSFAVEEDFEAARRDLRVLFKQASAKNGSTPLRYGFEELSDGQRALIVLYTLLFCTLEKDATLIIDEPENYIALRELQPWLMLLRERLEEHGGQVILISHHPEFINALAPSHTTVFERDNGGPVRIKPFDTKLSQSLAPSEIMARGWENE